MIQPNSYLVRPLKTDDIPSITSYWTESDPEYLVSLGVDLSLLPSAEAFEAMLRGQIETPLNQKMSYCLIWEVDGQAIGHNNVNGISFGDHASMHLHIWDKKWRRKGIGEIMLRKSIPVFFADLRLSYLVCEPYALNAAPNRTLEKLGFKMEKEYTTTPGSINFEQPVKRWLLQRKDVPG